MEEFRLPVLEGRIAPADSKPWCACAGAYRCAGQLRGAGGGAANLPVRVSALVRSKYRSLPTTTCSVSRRPAIRAPSTRKATMKKPARPGRACGGRQAAPDADRNGTGKVTIDNLPQSRRPRELLLEATYADPNGEVQPCAAPTRCGLRAWWRASRPRLGIGQPEDPLPGPGASANGQAARHGAAGETIARGHHHHAQAHGGRLYSYDNQTSTKDLGTVYTGKSDSRGLLAVRRQAGRGR